MHCGNSDICILEVGFVLNDTSQISTALLPVLVNNVGVTPRYTMPVF